ncbi:MAG: ComF family protein [Patescibacteria group bacterium]
MGSVSKFPWHVVRESGLYVLDFFFPKKCLGCGKTGGYFCPECLNFVSLDPQRICPVCERLSIGGRTHPGCQTQTTLDGLTSIFSYKGIIKKGISKLKYHFVSDLASDLVEIFLGLCGEDKTFSDFCLEKHPCLVPIPLHPRREKWRGFNQSALLGKMIAKNLNLDFAPDLIKRIKNTKPQIKLKEKERKENIKGAFRVSPTSHFALLTSPLILFDDVWTSGATLKEAGEVLKRAGAKKVWGLTLAR